MTNDYAKPTITVQFRPGRFRYTRATALRMAQPTWIIGREDDGQICAFVFDENAAKQVVLALNLADAYVNGDREKMLEMTKAFEQCARVVKN